MKSIKILLPLACSALATTAFASDDYVDLGYAGHTSKFYNQTYHLKLSKELSDNVVGTLEYNTTYADWRDPGEHEEFTTHSFLFDIYKLFPLNDNAEAFGLRQRNYKATGGDLDFTAVYFRYSY
jgi:hypothetical protein